MSYKSKKSNIVSAIKDIAISMTASFDLDTLLQSIVETCTKLSNASRGALFLYNEEAKKLVMRAEKGNAPELRFDANYSVDLEPYQKNIGLTAYIFLTRETLVLNSAEDIVNHPAHKGKYDDQQYPGKGKCQSLVGLPLINPISGLSIGILKIENTIDRKPSMKFTKSEIEVFKIMADIASASIVRFQNQLSRINTSITKLSNEVKGPSSLRDKLRRIASTFKDITHADGASIWLINGSKLICKGGVGHYEKMEDIASYDLSFDPKTAKKVGLTAWIAVSGEMINIKSYQELLYHPQHKGTYDKENYPDSNLKKCESFIGAPLKIGNKIIGVIKADYRIPDQDHSENYFTQEEAQIFSYLAFITAIVVENHQDYERAMTHDRQIINLYKIGTDSSNTDRLDQILWNLLTGLTHNDGIGFNRAIIFEFSNDRGPHLEGLLAVGPLNIAEGHDIQKALDSGKMILKLEDCLNAFYSAASQTSKLQQYIFQKRIDIDPNCAVMTFGFTKDHPVSMCMVNINNFCDNLKSFFCTIDSNKTNDTILLFSIRKNDGQPVVGFCDYVYTKHEIDNFIKDATETFLNQISLAISRLELKKTEEDARQRAWREFSAPTAHRIGTEIGDMSGALHWIEKNISDSESGIISESCSRLRTSLKRIRSAVDEYIELARPPEIKWEPISINDLITESINIVSTEVCHNILIQKNLSANMPSLEGDRERLLYAFREIYHNALKEMENGGEIHITTNFDETLNIIEIAISDTGRGIPDDIIDKVFEFGFKGRQRGTGLGLYIVKKTVEELGGSITVSQCVTEGACFKILLPSRSREKFLHKKILIVEDTESRRLDIKRLITEKLPIMQILEARNEHEAISLIQNNALDIVITDIALDEGGGTVHGGIKIMESIVTMNIKPKIIAITAHRGFRYQEKGNFETGVFDKAKELGAFACLLSSDDDFLMKLDETIDSL